MIKKVVKKLTLEESGSKARDLEYWLSRPPSERIAAVEYYRRQVYGSDLRLQRVARVIYLRDEESDSPPKNE